MNSQNTAIDPLEGHIDRQLLKSFLRLLGPETYATIVAEVDKDLQLYQEGIRSFTRESDSVSIRKFLHRLDGFAKQFGFKRLAEFSTKGLAMAGAECTAVLQDCEEELLFLCAHRTSIFLNA